MHVMSVLQIAIILMYCNVMIYAASANHHFGLPLLSINKTPIKPNHTDFGDG